MADKIGSRKNSSFKAISTTPDMCKTPVGSSTPPLPYQIVSDLNQSLQTVPSVKLNGDPIFVLNQSKVPKCTGDEPGTAKGVRSGTQKGETKPTKGSTTTRAGKKPAIRDADPCTMNKGNTKGIFKTQAAASAGVDSSGKPSGNTSPPLKPTPKEKTFREKLDAWWQNAKFEMKEAVAHPMEGFKGALKGVANLVPQAGELLVKGSMYQSAGDMEQAAATQSLFGMGKNAQELQSSAEGVRQAADGVSLPQFSMNNPAQEGGDKISTGLQLLAGGVGIVKGGWKAGAKALGKGATKEAKAGEEVVETVVKAEGKDGLKVLPRRVLRTADEVNAELRKKGLDDPFMEKTSVVQRDAVPGEKYQMVLDEAQVKKLRNGDMTGLGGWATPNEVPNQTFAREQLAIRPDFKKDVSFVAEIEVTKKVPVLDGVAGSQGALPGGGKQIMIDMPWDQRGDYFKIVKIKPLPKG